MQKAIKLANKAEGSTWPNPIVGCVIVKNDRVIASGFHKYFGGPHAEVVALKKAGKKAKGAIMYVTLEPCSSYGKTPPCTDRIITSGIKEVFIAMKDPTQANKSKGIKQLQQNSIKVHTGLLKAQAEKLNPHFIKNARLKRPFVSLKMAQSLDGKIATKSGHSRWISSGLSRTMAHNIRAKHDAVMIGINTLLADDPLLNIRRADKSMKAGYKYPVKIVIDSRLRTPLDSRIFNKLSKGRTIIAATKGASLIKEKRLKKLGAEVIRSGSGKVDLSQLLTELSKRGINNILVEGGGELAASLFASKLVDKLFLFIAPILIGGRDAITSIEGIGPDSVKKAVKLNKINLKKIGKDFLLTTDVHRHN
jgi:diaminohydroxyphosphoribosylaminopyrimidine deaminase/5-amino-6-(5-phosphoribosylamino)uracil reductase